MTAPTPADPLLDWAHYYTSLGFRVFPVDQGKRPIMLDSGKRLAWGKYRQRAPTEHELYEWFHGHTAETRGIAIICGYASGNVSCLDVDHWPFVHDLRQQAQVFLDKTWAPKSGSGKQHIYVRAKEGLDSSVINSPGGERVADIKGNDSYMVVPPSPHESGGCYEMLYGSPEHIAEVQNASDLMWRLYRKWSGREAPTLENDKRILPPLPEDEAARLAYRIRSSGIPMRTVHAIFGDPGWELQFDEQVSDSERQFSLLSTFSRQNPVWSLDDVEAVFATFACGDLCYRDPERPNHGRGHLAHDYMKLLERSQEVEQVVEDIKGVNFAVVAIRKTDYGETPVYDVTVADLASPKVRTFSITAAELWQQRIFLREVSAHLDIFAELRPDMSGRKYDVFLRRLMLLVEVDEVPEDMKLLGHTRGYIISVLSRGGLKVYTESERPQLGREFTYGWTDGVKLYLRGHKVAQEVSNLSRPSISARAVWTSLKDIGAQQVRYDYANGAYETLWSISAAALNVQIPSRNGHIG